MKKNYLNPQELAGLWGISEKQVRKLIKEMQEIGDWKDSMIKPLRTVLVTDEAFEEYLQWRVRKEDGTNKQNIYLRTDNGQT